MTEADTRFPNPDPRWALIPYTSHEQQLGWQRLSAQVLPLGNIMQKNHKNHPKLWFTLGLNCHLNQTDSWAGGLKNEIKGDAVFQLGSPGCFPGEQVSSK